MIRVFQQYIEALRRPYLALDRETIIADMECIYSALVDEDRYTVEGLRDYLNLCPEGKMHFYFQDDCMYCREYR